MQTTTITGPYDIARQSAFFGGWVRPQDGDERTILMAFPLEGPAGSAAVLVRQTGPQAVEGTVHGTPLAEQAWRQAMAVLSLDEDGAGFAAVGERDPVIGRLQRESAYLRPVLFHSPYEAACHFVIAHRIRIEQGRAIRARIARDHGEAFAVGGSAVHAFPRPEVLRGLGTIAGLDPEKTVRLHGIADAALEGRLDRARLRAMPVDDAIAELKRLRGIGDFFATAIVLRGASRADALPEDEMTRSGMQRLYGDQGAPAEAWRPYRMWCSVLVHADERTRRGGGTTLSRTPAATRGISATGRARSGVPG